MQPLLQLSALRRGLLHGLRRTGSEAAARAKAAATAGAGARTSSAEACAEAEVAVPAKAKVSRNALFFLISKFRVDK